MINFLEECENCEGHGIIQSGSLAGNDCHQCVQGYKLNREGQILAELIQREIKAIEEN